MDLGQGYLLGRPAAEPALPRSMEKLRLQAARRVARVGGEPGAGRPGTGSRSRRSRQRLTARPGPGGPGRYRRGRVPSGSWRPPPPRRPDDTDHASSASLSEHVRAFLAATRFATIATVDPDGGPRQAVIWYRLDGDVIVLNSKVGRRWPSNLERDPRISLAIGDQADGYRWVGLTGTVTIVEDQPTAQADIAEMARRYHADDPEKAERLVHDRFEQQRRVSFRISIDAVHDHLDD